jgi:apolipoprotein N-acyltransferase
VPDELSIGNQRTRIRYLLAAITGVVLGFAFPKFSVAGLAWIAPGLLLFAAAGCEGKKVFRIGWLGGFAFYLFTLYWLLYIPLAVLPFFGWLALSAYVALYPALWVWLTWKLHPRELPRAQFPWSPEVLDALTNTSWWQRAIWALHSAALWVALEMVLARFLSGFPWEFLGVSQYQLLPLIQIASVTGVYGVSFLIVWFSVSLLLAGVALTRSPLERRFWIKELALPLVVTLLAGVMGFRAIRDQPQPARTVRLALIQPSIPQTLIWDEKENDNRFTQLMRLTERALTNRVDAIVWPEASVPNMLRHHLETLDAITELVQKHEVWAILGSDDAEYRQGTMPRQIDYFNSAFAVSPRGELSARYIKRQLVIFGEYMPFAESLPFLRKISPAGEAGFTRGKEPAIFHLSDIDVRASVLICFEDTFPHLVPEYVNSRVDLLVNLTNNGWFGESAAQWQHAAAAAFRAVENRIPLVRCSNNGLSCWVDSTGGMHNIRFAESDDIYQAGFKIVTVPVLGPGQTRELSFYTRHGDVFGWSCVALTAISLLARWATSRRQRNLVSAKTS